MAFPASHLVIISPFYLPAMGGASLYYSTLSSQLLNDQAVEKVTIFTEAYPGSPNRENFENGRLTVCRIFPFRAGNIVKNYWVGFLYFIQNLQILTLPYRISRHNTIVLIHGYFHNLPGLMPLSARVMRMFLDRSSRLIADLRDPLLPMWAFRTLAPYDAIICCSQNVLDHISKDERLSKKAQIIPIPFEVRTPSDVKIKQVLSEYGLKRCQYVYSPNGVQQNKNIDELIEMVRQLRERGHDLILVVSGRKRDWGSQHDKAQQEGLMRYIGLASHEESICLTAGSALVPVISPESISRAAIEALAVGTTVMLPSNVPEFRKCCEKQVAKSTKVKNLVELAERLLHGGNNAYYDLSIHRIDRVAAMYSNLFKES